jgi:DNA-binding MarR family transcriptional regulator
MIDRSSNVSRLVEKLRVKGLVSRTACDEDRRAVDLEITGKGLDVLAQIDEDIETEHISLADTLTGAEAKELNGLLDKVRG